MKWLDQYTGILRQIRLFYWMNNLAHRNVLRENKEIYRSLGITRSVLRGIDSRVIRKYIPDFGKRKEERKPEDASYYDELPPALRSAAGSWNENGFIFLPGYFDTDTISRLNEEIEQCLDEGKLHFNYTGKKIFNIHESIPLAKELIEDKGLHLLMHCLMNRKPLHFQTISFLRGSEQRPHSDAVHMTTVPLNNLIGIWVALEDIGPDNGPLIYYPGSHKLPVILNGDYGNASNWWLLDDRANEKYEQAVEKVIRDNQLEESVFYAKTGDVIIWHSNLLHGGAPVRDESKTRKSMVTHYFGKGALCFHEISERPAIIVNK